MIWWKGDIKSLIEICTITISQLFYTIYYGTYFAQLLDNKRKKIVLWIIFVLMPGWKYKKAFFLL